MKTSSEREPFNICLFGQDDFGNALDSLITRRFHDMPTTIYRFAHSTARNERCEPLFVSVSKQPFLPSVIKSLQQPAPTISDASHFAGNGGMIEFVSSNKHICFKTNLQQAHAAGLSVPAPLLELASVVATEQQRDTP